MSPYKKNFAAALLIALAAAAVASAPVEAAAPFNGYAELREQDSGFLQVPPSRAFTPEGALTIELVARTRDLAANQHSAFVGRGFLESYGVGTLNGQLVSFVSGGSSRVIGGTIPRNEWVHVAVVSDGVSRRHYINGVEVVNVLEPSGVPRGNDTVPLQIGNDPEFGLVRNCDIDEVRIWKAARTATQIAAWKDVPIEAAQPGLVAVYSLDGNGSDKVGGGNAEAVLSVVWGSPDGGPQTLFVPVVLKNAYSSELTLANRGSSEAAVTLRYTASGGGGSGVTTLALPPGRQRVIPDAIEFLRSAGLSIDTSGTAIGTLLVTFEGLSEPDAGAVTVRTGRDVASPSGRAGLAYAGIPLGRTLDGTAYVPGLRFGASTDRSNLALQHAGLPGEPDVTLRVTILSGDAGRPFSRTLPDETLAAGSFLQFAPSDMSLEEGFEGYARVERVSGSSRFYAYGVINDQVTNDGSFIPPVRLGTTSPNGATLPSVVESGPFRTELVVANLNDVERPATLRLVPSSNPAAAVSVTLALPAGSQMIVPDGFAFFREKGGLTLPPPAGTAALFLEGNGGNAGGLYVAARTSAASPAGGRFGVFYPGVAAGTASPGVAWIHGLRQDASNRSNLAFVSTGQFDDTPIHLRLEIFDGDTGQRVLSSDDDSRLISLQSGVFVQLGGVLSELAPGVTNAYARVTRLTGNDPFIVYGVVNDGGQPGQRTGDGAYLAMDLPYETP